MAADSPPIKAPDIPRTASKVSQSQYCRPNDKQERFSIRYWHLRVQLNGLRMVANLRTLTARAICERFCSIGRSSKNRSTNLVYRPVAARRDLIRKKSRRGGSKSMAVSGRRRHESSDNPLARASSTRANRGRYMALAAFARDKSRDRRSLVIDRRMDRYFGSALVRSSIDRCPHRPYMSGTG